MSVLVTGGAGYIGSHTVRQLVESGADVVVLPHGAAASNIYFMPPTAVVVQVSSWPGHR